ncbi:uncharacterized protein [Nicotiana sylvestris]|uniref:uncharacterized protein n=1 Tax=Nicotiana sylvestris TaxID=4096 RepID=UPI00388CCE81
MVNQAYAMVISDESQKSVAANAGLLGANPTSGTSQFDMAMYTKTGGNYEKTRKNFNLNCDVCKMKGHSKKNCYKVIGYPTEYRPRKKNTNTHSAYNVLSDVSVQGNQLPRGNWNENCVQNSQLTSSTVSANNSQNFGQMANTPWMGNCTFTKEQYDHIVQLLNKDNSSVATPSANDASTTTTPSANAAGIPCALLASNSLQEWIIDTRTTNHMVVDIELLNKVSLMQTNQSKKVHLPNGETTQVTHIGTSTLTDQDIITNVFYIPQFKYNLLYVSKLTKELKYSVAFFPDFCIFQELFSGRVKVIGKKDNGLYILSRQKLPRNNAISLNTKETKISKATNSNDIELWHRRLGHVSATVLKKLFSTNAQDISAKIYLCTTCPCAKQTRQPFPISSIKTAASFELVDIDVWGPYKIPTMDVRTDNGTKFVNSVCENFFKNLGVIHQKTCPYTPQQNGVAESKHRHILELTRGIRFQANIPIKFWGYCVLAAGDLLYEIHMQLPRGFTSHGENKVCRLVKSLYGLKQAPRQWNAKLTEALMKSQFQQSRHDQSLFFKKIAEGITMKTAEGITVVLIYVDDMLVTGDSLKLIEETKAHLQQSFKMKDLSELKYLLGIKFARSEQGILMHQRKYALELIFETGVTAAKPSITPLDTNMKLTTTEYDEHLKKTKSTAQMNEELADLTSYQRLIDKLLYLTMTRLDISFSVQTLSPFLQRPKKSHMEATLRVVKYIKNSPGQGILLSSKLNNTISAYCDADWATCPFSRKSISELIWLIGLLKEVEVEVKLPVEVFSDSKELQQILFITKEQSTSRSTVISSEKKIVQGLIKTTYISTKEQPADMLTKGLNKA